jgi:hypothetical protein
MNKIILVKILDNNIPYYLKIVHKTIDGIYNK